LAFSAPIFSVSALQLSFSAPPPEVVEVVEASIDITIYVLMFSYPLLSVSALFLSVSAPPPKFVNNKFH
jgi:hypothetical protein